MKKLLENKKLILLSVLIVAVSILFLFVGYYVSLILFPMLFGDTEGINPYYNVLTPICMIISFFLYETIVLLIFYLKNRRKQSFLEKLPDDVVSEEDVPVSELTDQDDVDMDAVVEKVIEEETKKAEAPIEEKEEAISVDEESDEDVFFDEELFLPLYNEYSMEQLKAMMRIKKYVDDVNADMLRQMFGKEMTAGEISDYIEIFYE